MYLCGRHLTQRVMRTLNVPLWKASNTKGYEDRRTLNVSLWKASDTKGYENKRTLNVPLW